MAKKTVESWKDTKRYWREVKGKNLVGKEIIVFDLETTGLSAKTERITEIAAVRFLINEDYSMSYIDELHQYINPGRPLSKAVTELTGLTDEFLSAFPKEEEVFADVYDYFGTTAVGGYNSDSFDCSFMTEYFGRMGKIFSPEEKVDAMKLAKSRLMKGTEVENYKLATVGDFFGVKFNAHSAIEDVKATAKVLELLMKECMNEEESTPELVGLLSVATLRPKIKAVRYWPGYKGFSRIYVQMDVGSVYYDVRGGNWGNKDVEDFNELDMQWIESECWKLVGAADEHEFARFNGNVYAKA